MGFQAPGLGSQDLLQEGNDLTHLVQWELPPTPPTNRAPSQPYQQPPLMDAPVGDSTRIKVGSMGRHIAFERVIQWQSCCGRGGPPWDWRGPANRLQTARATGDRIPAPGLSLRSRSSQMLLGRVFLVW